ncbi:DUF1351 domain-containing protein [Leuconostoc carnosum]|uniref:DUF1351 domain-containing protein n=1 Tax=Leuconostoc carnosum TaxID=1252 RepID=UPI00123C2BF8|nr:DUF1351 domain-containing protein [Leuconostoc carnosum]KAA8365697.1 DUF1351 domain-containing protein [Leuconostoc carnosum]KAA8372384.1 DUF1351 domain-containing protein [Leuconostoc carnosum]KAA8377145.1 DUF1351 domain-containing protein [Leuconostoc carnosum]WLC97614.1 DUF1351 domain-containing protein [Leuconostoc carnosum]WLC98151.1 DUF1351 domain-containing protein [Leuconostoc carnosum]
MTNEVATINLEIKTLTPAHIEAPNLDDLAANTDKMLAKYKEFPVVEENYEQAKEQRSVLNSTIKDIADQRKSIEKKIIGNWAEIKPKMMAIEKAGKSASDLMKQQMVPVENERKERRHVVIMNDVTAKAQEQGVDWARIQFNEKWLNKTYSRNDMLTEIDTQIEQIHKDDELRVLRINDIEVCANGFKVDPDPYISMLGMRDVVDIKSQIKRDVEIKEARIAEAKRVQEETEKAAKEREANANVVGDKLIDENGEVITPKPVEKVFERTLHVTGTIAELKSVAEFMATHHIKFRGGK